MALTDSSISFLTETLSTFEPPLGLLNPGEPFSNVADGRLWTGTTTDNSYEIGLNARSGLLSETGKYLIRRSGDPGVGVSSINIPYDPQNIRQDEYYEFFILFEATIFPFVAFDGTYSQPVDWGSIPDPLIDLLEGKSLLVKFFAYGAQDSWFAIPEWSDDDSINIFKGSSSKFYYTEVEAPSGLIMPQRGTLKFQSLTTATLTDDLANDATIVELGRNLVTRITGQSVVSLDYNLSEYYVLVDTDTLDLPGGASPTDPFEFVVKNENSTNLTINQGTLTTLPPGEFALILYDGVSYSHIQYSSGGGGGTDESVKVSSNDTTAGFLINKLVAGSNITLTENNDGALETLTIDSTGGGGTDESVKVSPNDTTAGFLIDKLVAGSNITLTENNDGALETLTIDSTGGGGETYVEINSTGTVPVSTGTDAIAIGETSVASGNETVAIGSQASATFTRAVAIGYQADAGSGAVALGNQATVGAGAFGSIAIGTSSSTTGQGSTSIGQGALCSVNNSVQLAPGSNTTINTLQFQSVPVANNNSVLTGHTAVNYTPTAANELDDHLAAIDTALGGAGGGETYVEINSTGTVPSVTGVDSIAIGAGSDAIGTNSISIGQATTATGVGSIVIGSTANAASSGGIAIGNTASASNTAAIAIGLNTIASGDRSFAAGEAASATGFDAIAIGDAASAAGTDSIAIGDAATVTSLAISSIQLGAGSNATSNTLQYLSLPVANSNSVLTGHTAVNYTPTAANELDDHLAAIDTALGAGGGEDYVAINSTGTLPVAGGADNIVIGEVAIANANATRNVVIGVNAEANIGFLDSCVVIGDNATAISSGDGAIIIGLNAIGGGTGSIAIGDGADSSGSSGNSIAIGSGTSVGINLNQIALGHDASATGTDSVAIGDIAVASQTNSIQLGGGTNSTINTLQYLTNPIATNQGTLIRYQTTGVAPGFSATDGTLVLDNNGGTTTLYARANGAWVSLVSV